MHLVSPKKQVLPVLLVALHSLKRCAMRGSVGGNDVRLYVRAVQNLGA